MALNPGSKDLAAEALAEWTRRARQHMGHVEEVVVRHPLARVDDSEMIFASQLRQVCLEALARGGGVQTAQDAVLRHNHEGGAYVTPAALVEQFVQSAVGHGFDLERLQNGPCLFAVVVDAALEVLR